MGLDQYLYAERELGTDGPALFARATTGSRYWSAEETPDDVYVSGYSFVGADEAAIFNELLDATGLRPLYDPETPSLEVTRRDGGYFAHVTCSYWRKANAVHDWFVEECQGGVDECQLSDPIPAEKLAHLIHLCKQAGELYDRGLTDQAADVLRPRAGFFFGGTEVDEWYRKDLETTVAQLERAINAAIAVTREARIGITFRYRSSW